MNKNLYLGGSPKVAYLGKVKMEKENKQIVNIAKGVGISFASTVVLLLVFSAVLTYTNVQEHVINPVIIVITAVSILIGSSIGNIKIRKNGLLNGAIIGGLYMVIIYTISSILNWSFGLNFQAIVFIAVGMIFGILGGIIGVNKK